MRVYKLHILYEYGADLRPHGSAFIRLLRPLSHPSLREQVEVTHGLTYEGQAVDGVIADRFWHRKVTFAQAAGLVETIRRASAAFIYALDDNLLELSPDLHDITKEQRWVVEFFLRQADQVIVTTRPLRDQLASFNANIVVMPNALDERLLPSSRSLEPAPALFEPRPIVIGYMGTLTHDEDLLMILPALKEIGQRYAGLVEFQVIGAVGREETRRALAELPARFIQPRAEEIEYPLFILWFGSEVHWDIGLAPLRDTPFTRGKSDIKFLDYSAIGAAGIYSRVPAYESTVRHRQTGWLVDNKVEAWLEALEALLADEPLRRKVARQAAEYLYTERTLARRARDWLGLLENLLNGTALGEA